jgi:hypothetical protein
MTGTTTAQALTIVRLANFVAPADDLRHHARGTGARLDLRASASVSAALAALPVPERPEPEVA